MNWKKQQRIVIEKNIYNEKDRFLLVYIKRTIGKQKIVLAQKRFVVSRYPSFQNALEAARLFRNKIVEKSPTLCNVPFNKFPNTYIESLKYARELLLTGQMPWGTVCGIAKKFGVDPGVVSRRIHKPVSDRIHKKHLKTT